MTDTLVDPSQKTIDASTYLSQYFGISSLEILAIDDLIEALFEIAPTDYLLIWDIEASFALEDVIEHYKRLHPTDKIPIVGVNQPFTTKKSSAEETNKDNRDEEKTSHDSNDNTNNPEALI